MIRRFWQRWKDLYWRNKWLRYVIHTVAIFLGLLISLFAYVWIIDVPPSSALRHPDIKEASKIYDQKGRYIGQYLIETRYPILSKDINPYIKQGLIAVEDTRFYEHSGIDVKALGRVIAKTIFMGDDASGGGSTLTQQLAKQLYPRPNVRSSHFIKLSFYLLKAKFKEWIIASKLENIYSKDEIMTMYLNKFEFINGAHGIEAAARTYFGCSQKELTLSQAATLIGMLKNPSLFNPVRFLQKTQDRRNEVLTKMGDMYRLDVTAAKGEHLDMKCFARIPAEESRMPYFQQALAHYTTQLFSDQKMTKSDGSLYDIYRDGLRIETSIDLDMQRHAEMASHEHLVWLQEWFFKLWKGYDPWTYKADAIEKANRAFTITQRIWASDRYKSIKKAHWKEIKQTWPKDLAFEDVYIEYLLRPENGANTVSKTERASLDAFGTSKEYAQTKPLLISMQSAVEKEFNTPIVVNIYDPKMGTKTAKMSPIDSIRYHAMIQQNAMVVMDPRSGQIKSWVGGPSFDYFKFDHVMSRRAIGSTMKPFLYTVAMQKGIKPCVEYIDQEYSIEPGEGEFRNKERWAPHNATEIFTTLKYNMYHGLLYSKNSITVKLLKEIGSIEPLRDLLDQIGISKTEKLPNGQLACPQWPSVALGAVDVNVLQMAAAYATFANQGKYTEPVWITKITNKEGHVIYQSQPRPRQVIDPLYNAIMVDMLQNVVGGEFTMGLKSQNAGKTGTTNDQCDGWFCGFTPSLVAAVWTGGDDKFMRFDNTDIGQGYYTARPVFEKFMKRLEDDKTGLYDRTLKFAPKPQGFKELTNCAKIKTEPLPEFVRKKLDLINLLRKPVSDVNAKKVEPPIETSPKEVAKDSVR